MIERPHKKCRDDHSCGAVRASSSARKGRTSRSFRKKLTDMTKVDTHFNIVEIRKPERRRER